MSMESKRQSDVTRDNGPLCASCDRCRQRKTKCDGDRPCSCCLTRYIKLHPLEIESRVTAEMAGCVYSVAKKRGPVPGNSLKKSRSAYHHAGARDDERRVLMKQNTASTALPSNVPRTGDMRMGNEVAMAVNSNGDSNIASLNVNVLPSMLTSTSASGQPLHRVYAASYPSTIDELYKQVTARRQVHSIHNNGGNSNSATGPSTMDLNQQQVLLQQADERTVMALKNVTSNQHHHQNTLGYIPRNLYPNVLYTKPSTLEHVLDYQKAATMNQLSSPSVQYIRDHRSASTNNASRVAGFHPLHLSVTSAGHASELPKNRLSNSNRDGTLLTKEELSEMLSSRSSLGNLLRAYYQTTVNELFCFPTTPSKEEFCYYNSNGNMNSLFRHPAEFDFAAIYAAGYAELAIGAYVMGKSSLASEMASATVISLKNCVEEPVQKDLLFDLAKTYFLLGIFRWFLGDVRRYLMYRRACMAHVMQLEFNAATNLLLAAIAIQDSVVSLQFNFQEEILPDIDKALPPLYHFLKTQNSASGHSSFSFIPRMIVCDPIHQRWFKGSDHILKVHSIPTKCVMLHKIASALRSYADDNYSVENLKQELIRFTKTIGAVESDLNVGCEIAIRALTILLQANSEISVHTMKELGTSVLENPGVLFHAGPTYHLISSVVIRMHTWLCTSRKIKANSKDNSTENDECIFDNMLEIYSSIRYLLMKHRSKLPIFHRCHQIPHVETEISDVEASLHQTSCNCICRSFIRIDGVKLTETNTYTEDFSSKESDINDDSLLTNLSQILKSAMLVQ